MTFKSEKVHINLGLLFVIALKILEANICGGFGWMKNSLLHTGSVASLLR